MTITPRYIADRIIRLAQMGDKSRDVSIDERDIIPLVLEYSAKLMKAEMYKLRQDQDVTRTTSAHYIHTYRKVPVKKLVGNGMNFIDLPNNYVALPYNEGVRRVAPYSDNDYVNKAMIPVQHEEMDLYGSLLGNMQKQWVYYVEGSRVYFYKRCNKTLCEEGIDFVSVSLVTFIGDIDKDTPLVCPPELIADIIASVLQLMSVAFTVNQIKDVLNDNNVLS